MVSINVPSDIFTDDVLEYSFKVLVSALTVTVTVFAIVFLSTVNHSLSDTTSKSGKLVSK